MFRVQIILANSGVLENLSLAIVSWLGYSMYVVPMPTYHCRIKVFKLLFCEFVFLSLHRLSISSTKKQHSWSSFWFFLLVTRITRRSSFHLKNLLLYSDEKRYTTFKLNN